MVNMGSTNVLETPRNGPQDLDWICTLFTFTMVGVQIRSKGQDDKYEGTAECRDEEKYPGCTVTVRHGEGDAREDKPRRG
jgi:hypothetical protein